MTRLLNCADILRINIYLKIVCVVVYSNEMPTQPRCNFTLKNGRQCGTVSRKGHPRCLVHIDHAAYEECACGKRAVLEEGKCPKCLRIVPKPPKVQCEFLLINGQQCHRMKTGQNDCCTYHRAREPMTLCKSCGKPKMKAERDMCGACPEGQRESHRIACREYMRRRRAAAKATKAAEQHGD